MYSHITLGTNDIATAQAFYDPVMTGALGHPLMFKTDTALAYGLPAGEKLFVVFPFDGNAASTGNGTHVAFRVDSRDLVDAFYNAALANGGTDEGAPGPRPHYHPNYYGAYVRDPDGNKLQAVCHKAPQS